MRGQGCKGPSHQKSWIFVCLYEIQNYLFIEFPFPLHFMCFGGVELGCSHTTYCTRSRRPFIFVECRLVENGRIKVDYI